jgi:hypothetical protein
MELETFFKLIKNAPTKIKGKLKIVPYTGGWDR